MKHKRYAVISDNTLITNGFKAAIKANGLLLDGFSFFYSARNKNPNELITLGSQAIDLRKAEHVKNLTETFDIVFSGHCKQIFPPILFKTTPCINIHPGLNPFNRGWYPQVFSIINGLPIGVTVHLIDEKIDHGPIILQKQIEIKETDTSLDVYKRLVDLECKILEESLPYLLGLAFNLRAPDSEGNYNSPEDFRAMCRLDLNSIGTLQQHINLLRALTHGDFQNAYFELAGRKVFVRISLEALPEQI
jgi:methionyl-tRNA formyltransferase